MAAKKKTDEISEEELPGKIHEWLKHHGYPLEMRVTRAFRDADFTHVVQSEFYETRNKEGRTIHREIDVIASMLKLTQIGALRDPRTAVSVLFEVQCVVECKRTGIDRPWLVFTDPSARHDPFIQPMSHPATKHAQTFRELVIEDREAEDALSLYKGERVAYGAVCAALGERGERDDNADRAYKAVTGVLSAARSRLIEHFSGFKVFRFLVPVVVVGARLYECHLNQDGTDVALVPRDEVMLYSQNPGVGLDSAMVYLVTEAALPSFVKRVRLAYETLVQREDQMAQAIHSHEFLHNVRIDSPNDKPTKGDD